MNCSIGGALSLPIAPINSPLWNVTRKVHDIFTEQIGWHEMIQTVAGIYAELPEEEKARAGIPVGENDKAAALKTICATHPIFSCAAPHACHWTNCGNFCNGFRKLLYCWVPGV